MIINWYVWSLFLKKIERKKKILKGLEKAYEDMIEFKKQKKSKLVINKNDKIVKINLNFFWVSTKGEY